MGMYFLSDADIQVLQKLLDAHRGQLGNTPNRPPTEHSWSEGEDHQAPEVYIAKPQTVAGIPKLLPAGIETGTATGTAIQVSNSLYDEPGKALCDLYQIVTDGVSGDPELHQIVGSTQMVYNLTEGDLEQDWLTVIRTKFGRWVVAGNGGGTTTTVITNIQVDTVNLKIQKKTQEVRVIPVEAESDWIDVHVGDDCLVS